MRARLIVATSRRLDDPILCSTLGAELRVMESQCRLNDWEVFVVAREASSEVGADLFHGLATQLRSFASVRDFRRQVTGLVREEPSAATVCFRDVVDSAIVCTANPSLRRATIIHDVRGIPSLEMHLRGRSRRRQRWMSRLQRHEWQHAARLKVVSKGAADIVQDIVNVVPLVVPNLPESVEPSRRGLRTRIAYVGSDRAWQETEASLEMLRALRSILPEFDVCVASHSEPLRSKALELGLEARELVDRSSVESFLRETEAVLALRGTHPAVVTASPVKVSEALQHGCRVVGTPSTVEWMDQLVEGGRAFSVDLATWKLELNRLASFIRTPDERPPPPGLTLGAYIRPLVKFYLGGAM